MEVLKSERKIFKPISRRRRLAQGSEGARVDLVDLVVDDQVVASTTGASGRLEIGAMPSTEHWVRVRATCRRGDWAVIIESPIYKKNPWWPYGGRGD